MKVTIVPLQDAHGATATYVGIPALAEGETGGTVTDLVALGTTPEQIGEGVLLMMAAQGVVSEQNDPTA